jgi:hypothetical protein
MNKWKNEGRKERIRESRNELIKERIREWTKERKNELNKWSSEWMKERMIEWKREWKNERKNLQMNERMKETLTPFRGSTCPADWEHTAWSSTGWCEWKNLQWLTWWGNFLKEQRDNFLWTPRKTFWGNFCEDPLFEKNPEVFVSHSECFQWFIYIFCEFSQSSKFMLRRSFGWSGFIQKVRPTISQLREANSPSCSS